MVSTHKLISSNWPFPFQSGGISFIGTYLPTSVTRSGDFSDDGQSLICPNLPTFLGNFCKGVKIYHFSSEIIFGNFFWHLTICFWSHWTWSMFLQIIRLSSVFAWTVQEWMGAIVKERVRGASSVTRFLRLWATFQSLWQQVICTILLLS